MILSLKKNKINNVYKTGFTGAPVRIYNSIIFLIYLSAYDLMFLIFIYKSSDNGKPVVTIRLQIFLIIPIILF